MAPYNPPVSHYTELDVSEYDEDFMFAFVGRGGRRHYWLTRMVGVDYLWYDHKRKVIEIWGPFNVLQTRQAQELLKSELEIFQPKLGDINKTPNVDPQTPAVEA
tara:strand:+ start:672 stop:983 length:312 start_codon:yes stop_codon:yes gene_type:complete